MKNKLLTLEDAVSQLGEKTGKVWTKEDILRVAIFQITLYAVPNQISPVVIRLFNNRNELLSERNEDWAIAELGGEQIEQLLISGCTSARYADGNNQLVVTRLPTEDLSDGSEPLEYWQSVEFSPPIMVELDSVRVPAARIKRIEDLAIQKKLNLKSIDETGVSSQKKVVPKLSLQEDAILECLHELGYVAEKLPKYQSGKTWVKSEVKDLMLKNPQLFTLNSFAKAWDRLRADGRIKELP